MKHHLGNGALFKESWTNVHDDERSGQWYLSLILKKKVDNRIQEDKTFNLTWNFNEIYFMKLSWTIPVTKRCVPDEYLDYCLTITKIERLGAALTFLPNYLKMETNFSTILLLVTRHEFFIKHQKHSVNQRNVTNKTKETKIWAHGKWRWPCLGI